MTEKTGNFKWLEKHISELPAFACLYYQIQPFDLKNAPNKALVISEKKSGRISFL